MTCRRPVGPRPPRGCRRASRSPTACSRRRSSASGPWRGGPSRRPPRRRLVKRPARARESSTAFLTSVGGFGFTQLTTLSAATCGLLAEIPETGDERLPGAYKPAAESEGAALAAPSLLDLDRGAGLFELRLDLIG